MTPAETAALLAGIPTILTAVIAIITAFRANSTAKDASAAIAAHQVSNMPEHPTGFQERTGAE